MPYTVDDLERRSQMALNLRTNMHVGAALAVTDSLSSRKIRLNFPAALNPIPQPTVIGHSTLPSADVVVMVDTAAEANALADVMTPGYPRTEWHKYDYNYAQFAKQIGLHGPSRYSHSMGSYMLTKIGDADVLCYKTELHMHEDAIKLSDGSYTLPIKDVLKQIITETKPHTFLTTGTSGGVYPNMELGDVVITRAAKFACKKDFDKAPFNNKTFKSDWAVPKKYIGAAENIAQTLKANLAGKSPPDPHCAGILRGRDHPFFYLDGTAIIPQFHPVLTTDYFEFGTSVNDLFKEGVCVEMDDACLGLACSELGVTAPQWACVRNMSDPVINGKLPDKMQESCAEFYYQHFGYWTTVNSSLAAWAIIAGMLG